MSKEIDLPYFDLLLEGRSGAEPASEVFERYVHWGFWENPKTATKDPKEFMAAMDRLNSEIVAAADLKDNQKVLDAGCGFGGTLFSIQERWHGMSLTGINIDPRQLEVAKAQVPTATFIEGDACVLPFEDGSFDRVLAVECIFHFPSRFRFLEEASRVLKPGGYLALSDFVSSNINRPKTMLGEFIKKQIAKGYGEFSSNWKDGDYIAMAKAAGLKIVIDRDITKHTLPTYSVLDMLFSKGEKTKAMKVPTKWLKWASKLGLVRYKILGFVKN